MSPPPEPSVAPPLFIVGCGRSGTTLLRLMLDAHPEMAIPPESHFIPRLWGPRAASRTPAGFDTEMLIGKLLRNRRFRDWGVPEGALRERVAALTDPDFASVIEAAFMAYADRHGAIRWGDKTPNYVEHIPLLAGLWPGARFVHMVRDGRDVAPSLREMPWAPDDFVSCARLWRERVRAGRRHRHGLDPGRYLEVRYEDLVADTEGVLTTVCTFAHLDLRPEMLRYFEASMANIPAHERVQHRHLVRPPTSGLRDWRRDLSGRQVAVFEAVAGAELTAFGYERAVPEPSAWARVTAGAGLVRGALSRATKRSRKRLRREVALRLGRPGPGRSPAPAGPQPRGEA